jgi:putative transposase
LESGETAEAVCRSVNLSEAMLYRWKQQYGALELSEVKDLKALREENAQLRRVLADQVLKELNAKNGESSQEPDYYQERQTGTDFLTSSEEHN